MLTLEIEPLIELAKEIGRLGEVLSKMEGTQSDDVRKHNNQVMTGHRDTFDQLGLQMCKLHCERIIDESAQEGFTYKDATVHLIELYHRIIDESKSFHFIVLSAHEKILFDQPGPLFGLVVADKFPELAEDISEAGKCLSLRRPTAAVFHLMRVMEGGVQKFGDALGVSLENEPVWQVILDQINAKIKAGGKSKVTIKQAEIAGNLYNVKLAWRNETMHPKATYTDEEADNIFRAAKSYMQELSSIV